jgi:hypothetical protein
VYSLSPWSSSTNGSSFKTSNQLYVPSYPLRKNIFNPLLKAWFETFLETQMFSNFLETHSKSFSNPFDDLIDKQIFDMDKLDLDLLKVDNPPATTTTIDLPPIAGEGTCIIDSL